MNIALLVISIASNLFGTGILRSKYCKQEISGDADLHLFNALSSAFSAVALLGAAFFMKTLSVPSLYTVLLGALFGIVTALSALFSMKALGIGPLSYTSVITHCSMIIPALSGAVLYNESVGTTQYIGVALMMASFVCAVDKKNDRVGASPKWLLFCLLAFTFCGTVGVMQKIHQNSPHKSELAVFLVVAFAVSCVFSLVLAAVAAKTGKAGITVLSAPKRGKFVLYSVVCGALIAYCNQANLYLSGVMPSIVFFPVVNGAGLLLALIAGVVFFKERPSVRQWIGLVIGVAAMVLLM